MDWFRWWHGTVTDPKFQWVSRRCGLPLAQVIAVWACLLECASTATQGNADATRGNVASFDCNDFDVLLGLEDGTVEKILTAMKDKKLIADGRVAGWDGRQPKREDSGNPNTGALSSTERSRNYREKKRLEETQCNAMQRNATQSNDREEESREEKKEKHTSVPDVAFEKFWEAWPNTDRKAAKAKCREKWDKAGLGVKADEIISHVTTMKAVNQSWKQGFEPAPLTYLNQRRWEDGTATTAREARFEN
jgi:hypothetical protein